MKEWLLIEEGSCLVGEGRVVRQKERRFRVVLRLRGQLVTERVCSLDFGAVTGRDRQRNSCKLPTRKN
jgi:hypothetical protein